MDLKELMAGMLRLEIYLITELYPILLKVKFY